MTTWFVKVRTRLRGQLLQAVDGQDEEVDGEQRNQNRVKGPIQEEKSVFTHIYNYFVLFYFIWNSPVYDGAE